MSRSILIPILMLVPLLAATHAAGRTYGVHTAPIEFAEQLNDYADIHRAVAAALGPEISSPSPEEVLRQSRAFAAAVRAARPTARPGDIFTPRVAAFFRRHISAIVRETELDVTVVFDDLDEEPLNEAGLVVNGELPWNAGSFMWPSMLWRLPPLPKALEYRFIGHDLVLVDVRAGIVVDVLRNALPMGDEPPWQPCDVHPQLPACQS